MPLSVMVLRSEWSPFGKIDEYSLGTIYLMSIENTPKDFRLCFYVRVRVLQVQTVKLQTICVCRKMTLERMKCEPKIRGPKTNVNGRTMMQVNNLFNKNRIRYKLDSSSCCCSDCRYIVALKWNFRRNSSNFTNNSNSYVYKNYRRHKAHKSTRVHAPVLLISLLSGGDLLTFDHLTCEKHFWITKILLLSFISLNAKRLR